VLAASLEPAPRPVAHRIVDRRGERSAQGLAPSRHAWFQLYLAGHRGEAHVQTNRAELTDQLPPGCLLIALPVVGEQHGAQRLAQPTQIGKRRRRESSRIQPGIREPQARGAQIRQRVERFGALEIDRIDETADELQAPRSGGVFGHGVSIAPPKCVDKLLYPAYDIRQLLTERFGNHMLVPSTRRPLVRTTIDLQLERPDRRSDGIFRGWGITLSDRLPF